MIENIRKQYPQYSDLSDQQLADAFYSKYYSDIPKEQFYSQIGFTQQEPKKESFADKTGRVIETGLGNLGVGFTQLATSVGEKAAENIEKKIYGGNLQKETFGDRLAQQAALRKKEQEKLPFGQRLAIGAVETAPLAPLAAGMGLVTGSALLGGASSLVGMKDSSKLEDRVKEAGKDAAIGAIAAPIVNYGLQKTVAPVLNYGLKKASPLVNKGIKKIESFAGAGTIAPKIKSFFAKTGGTKAPDDKVSSMIRKNIPKKDIEAGIKQLEEGTDNLTGLDIESPAFENMFKTTLTKFPDSKQITNEFARGRLDKGYERINKSLDKVSLSKSGRENIAKLNEERKVITAPLYTAAEEANVAIPKFNYKTIKTTELPITTRFSNQTKTSGVKKDMQTDLESTEQFTKGGKAISTYDDEKGVITEGNKFLQSQKETGSFTSGTTKGDTITKTQSKIIQEGDKNIKIDREITNFKNLSAKEKQLAQQFERLKANELFDVAENGMKSLGFKTELNTADDLARLKIGLDEKIATMKNADLTRRATIFRKEIDELVGELNPQRKVADEIYSNYSKIINAGEEGLKFNFIPKTEVELYIKSLNPKQLEAYRASAKEALLEEVEKNIKTFGKNKPAEAIFNTDYDKTKIKTLFGEDKTGYDTFKREIIDEINYNKTLERYGLTNAQVMAEDNILPNIAGRLLSAGTGGGTTGLKFELGRIIEKIALRKYGLNKNNADALVKAMTNKENSLKVLKTAYNKISDKEQKELAKKFIQDISPAITATIID